MKRTLWALFSVLTLSLFGLVAPSSAQAAVSCSTVTVTSSAWPQNRLWVCTDGTTPPPTWAGDITSATQALQKLGSGSITTASDAKTRLTNDTDPAPSGTAHNFYLFVNRADYDGASGYCGPNASAHLPAPTPTCKAGVPSGVGGVSYKVGNVWSSVVFADKIHSPGSFATVGNTMAHEAGHQLDDVYGRLLYGVATPIVQVSDLTKELASKTTGARINVGTTTTIGDILTLTVSGSYIGTTPVVINYKVVASSGTTPETPASIATKFATLINADPTLSNSGILTKATASTSFINITSFASVKYQLSKTGVGGHAATEAWEIGSYDFPTVIDRAPQCGSSAYFTNRKSLPVPPATGSYYICASKQNMTVGGIPHNGTKITIDVQDNLWATIPPFSNTRQLIIDVTSADTTTAKIAAKIYAAMNTTDFTNIGITVAISGSVITITDGSGAPDTGATFTITLTNSPTETVSLGTLTGGIGNTLNVGWGLFYGTNDAVLRTAQPYYFKAAASDECGSGRLCWSELFAEATAMIAGQTTTDSRSPDYFIQDSFACVMQFVRSVEKNGVAPNASSFPYPTACQ